MRLDHQMIYDLIEADAKVLDLGCGDGSLLAELVRDKHIVGQGVEMNESCIYECVEKGVNVFHSNLEEGLQGYPDASFDYVVLNQSLQQVKNITYVFQEALRVGKRVIVGIPNFAHFHARTRLFFLGKTPKTKSLPYDWSTTPNVRFMSLWDFRTFCKLNHIYILKAIALGKTHRIRLCPNLLALDGIFMLKKSN